MASENGRRALLGLAVGVPVSLLFLWLAVRNADLAAVRSALADADAEWVALAVLAFAVMYGIQAARWRAVARAPHVGLARFYEMVISAVACNNVLPARLGDALRARWLGRAARIPAGRGFGTVVLDRGSDVAALLLLLVVGLTAVASSGWIVGIALFGALGLCALAAVVLFARGYTGRRARDRRSRRLVRRVARDTAELLAEPIGFRRPAGWIAVSLVAWFVWTLGAIAIARSLGLELTLVEAMFVASVMNLGVAIPSSPGFVGTYEALGVASLGLLGVGREEALAFAILLHAGWYVPTTLAGGLALGVRALVHLRRAWTGRAGAQAPSEPAR